MSRKLSDDNEEETEVFEITDFTNASPWERFIANLEEIFRDWNLSEERPRPKGPPIKFGQRVAEADFAGSRFILTHFYPEPASDDQDTATRADDYLPGQDALDDMMKRELDFPPRAHCLHRWYGLQEWVVMEPKEEAVLSPDKASLLLSSLAPAAAHMNCCVALFLQLDRKTRRLFEGMLITPQLRTSYEMVHLESPPPMHKHLDGLVTLFTNKLLTLGSMVEDTAGIRVTARMAYVIQDWGELSWPTEIKEGAEDFDMSTLGKIPFGCVEEPVHEAQVYMTWHDHSEKILHESSVRSDFDPMSAPEWSMRVVFLEAADGFLGSALLDFLKLCDRRESIKSILGLKEKDDSTNARQALARLANAEVSLQDVMREASRLTASGQMSSSLPVHVLDDVLQFVFPDAKRSRAAGDRSGQVLSEQLKAAPADSLTTRLAAAFLWTYKHARLKGVAHLWQEVVLELRYRWEQGIMLPGLGEENPDMAHCLLHQKLQMLNCCVRKKKDAERAAQAASGVASSQGSKAEGEESEEFFECEEELEGASQDASTAEFYDAELPVCEGRLRRLEGATLKETGAPLWIPISQEPAPLTEDALEEQAQVLARLGTDSEGSALRARMQSMTLIADMEAFKAANPGSVLEDFVRWYSPRDYVVEEITAEDGTTRTIGKLSPRMEVSDNAWAEAWSSARAVPVRRQKRLFDDTREAEKVLHYFSSLSPGGAASGLLSVLIQSALLEVNSHLTEVSSLRPDLHKQLDSVTLLAAQLTRAREAHTHKLQELMWKISQLETKIETARSLRHKLMTVLDTSVAPGLLERLLQGAECVVRGADARLKLAACLPRVGYEDTAAVVTSTHPIPLAPPHAKEFILRVHTSCSGEPSHLGQRMYCVVSRGEYRLAAAYSQPGLVL